MRQFLSIIVSAILVQGALAQGGRISGTVTDDESGQPLVGANIVVRGTLVGTATDREGLFRLRPLHAGTYVIAVSMVGYKTRVESVTVREESDQELRVQLHSVPIETDQIVVTASRREQSSLEVPASVSTVSATQIAERMNVTLDDALRYVPGVNMLQDQINIRGSTGYSRGVGSRVLLLLDGLPFITGDTGEINWETIPTGEIERIEVVKGAGSALYGSSALGGVINVITKDMPDHPELRFRLYSGMYNRPIYPEWDWSEKLRFNSGVTVGYADAVGQSFKYLLSVTRSVDDSYRENDAYHRWSVFTKMKYDLSQNKNITVVFNWLARKHGNFFWWKSLREATIPADVQRNGQVISSRGNVSVAYKEFISDRLYYTVKGMFFGNFWKDDSSGRINNVSNSRVFQGEVQATYDPGNGNILTFGLAGNADGVYSNLFGNHRGYGLAGYVQDEVSLGPSLKITAGARYDIQKASILPTAARLSPKLGAVYTISPGTALRASLGAGFRYPSIGELYISSSTNVSQLLILPNINLRAERSLTYEIGLAHRVHDNVMLDVALFSNDFNDLIEPLVKLKKIKLNPSDTVEVDRAVVEFDNVTRARIQGAEINVKVAWLGDLLESEVGYTSLWPEDLNEHTVLKFRPRHLFFGTTSLTLGPFRSSVDYRFVSRIERIDENLVQLAPIIQGDERVPIHVFDVRTSYRLTGFGLPLRVGFNVNNVFNYRYVELIGNLAPVRTFMLVIDGAF